MWKDGEKDWKDKLFRTRNVDVGVQKWWRRQVKMSSEILECGRVCVRFLEVFSQNKLYAWSQTIRALNESHKNKILKIRGFAK